MGRCVGAKYGGKRERERKRWLESTEVAFVQKRQHGAEPDDEAID